MEPVSYNRAKIISRATIAAVLVLVPTYRLLSGALVFILRPLYYVVNQVEWSYGLIVIVRNSIIVLFAAWIGFLVARTTYRFENRGHAGAAKVWHIIASILVIGLVYWIAYDRALDWMATYQIYPRELLGQIGLSLPAALIIWATGGVEQQGGSFLGAWLGSATGYWLYFLMISDHRISGPVPCCLVPTVPRPELFLLFIGLGLVGYYLSGLIIRKWRRV